MPRQLKSLSFSFASLLTLPFVVFVVVVVVVVVVSAMIKNAVKEFLTTTTTTTTTTSLFLTLNIQISHHLQIARLIEAGGVWTA